MSALIQQLSAAWKAVGELEELGVRVLSVRCSPIYEAPRIHVSDPGALLDHIDAQSIDTRSVRYCERGVQVAGCHVFWLIGADEAAASEAEEMP